MARGLIFLLLTVVLLFFLYDTPPEAPKRAKTAEIKLQKRRGEIPPTPLPAVIPVKSIPKKVEKKTLQVKPVREYSVKKAVPVKSLILTPVGQKTVAPKLPSRQVLKKIVVPPKKVFDGTLAAKKEKSEEEEFFTLDELNRKKTKGSPFRKVAGFSAKSAKKKTPEPKGKSRFSMPTRISAYSTYSTLIGSSSVFGGDASAVLAPTVEIRPGKSLILLYNGSYQKKKQIFTEDEGPQQTTEYTTHTLTPMFRYRYSPKLTITPSLFHTWELMKESSGDKWYQGLYDYRDFGAGIDFAYAIDMSKELESSFILTLQRYERRYPNFRSLISIAGISNLEEREKDFFGTLLSATYATQKRQGLSVTTSFSVLFKNYSDKQIEDSIGGRTGEKQKDQQHTITLMLGYRPDESWNYGLTGVFVFTESNQNLATGSFPDITFQKNYYSSYTAILRPNISYVRRLSKKHALKLGGTYSLTNIKYADRVARAVGGFLADVKETDWTHDFTLNALYSLDRRWSLGAILNYTIARSNSKDEAVYRYNYDIVNLSAGLTYQY